MKQIPLSQNKVALVDDEDFEYFNQWRWYAIKGRRTFYAARKEGMLPFRKIVFMHRQIMNTPDGMDVDHKDGDGLNDTRANMRNCTRAQNIQNVRMFSNNTSGYKGVSWNKRDRKWQTRINVNGKAIHLGNFSTAEDAALAYDKAAKKYHGEFAKLNFA